MLVRFLFLSCLSLFSASSFAVDFSFVNGYGNRFSNAYAACADLGAIAANVGQTWDGGYTISDGRFECPGTDPYGNKVSSIGGGSWSGDSCPTNTSSHSDGSGCYSPEQKCSANKGNKSNDYTWDQMGETPPSSISIDGCTAVLDGVSTCLPTTGGQYTCIGDVTFDGKPYKPPVIPTNPTTPTTPVPTPDPGTGTGTGSDTGTGTGTSPSNPGTTPGTGTSPGTGTGTGTGGGTGSGSGGSGSGSGGSSGGGTGSGGSTGGGSGGTTPGTGSGTSPGTGNGTTPGTGTGGDGTCETDCGEGDGPSTTSLTAPSQGSFDGQGEEWDQKIAAAKGQINKGLGDLKGVFSPIGDLSLSGGGSLYCPPPVTVMGASFSLCLDKYANSLSWIGSAVYAACAIIALFIVFG